MSRVGKRPIEIPEGVKITFTAPNIEVQGKGGKLKRSLPATVKVEVKDKVAHVSAVNDTPHARACHGLSRTLVNNMVIGVTKGFTKGLELQGVGYRAQAQGSKLNLSVGFSHPVEFPLPPGVTAQVEASTKITLSSADKDLLGLTAARIRKVRPPEPYKGKGIRYAGEQITLKQGKAAGK